MTCVLVLGAGGAAANGFCRALRLAGGYHLTGANINPTDLLLAECDDTHHVTDDDSLADLISRLKPDFVHAQPDEEVERLSRLRHIAGRYRTFLPYHQTILTCQDKWQSYLRWEAAGVPVPKTWLIRNSQDLAYALGGERWLRKIRGAGGAGSVATDDYGFACKWIDRHDGWGSFTAAEVLTANTVTWQSVWHKGRVIASQQRKRVTWANARNAPSGVSGSTGIGETCSDPDVETVAEAAVRAIDPNAHGLFGVDMAYDHEGNPRVTEINPGRFFTTAPEFYARAGFNMADLYVRIGRNVFTRRTTDRLRNPLPDGLQWLRGMDTRPVLVHKDDPASMYGRRELAATR